MLYNKDYIRIIGVKSWGIFKWFTMVNSDHVLNYIWFRTTGIWTSVPLLHGETWIRHVLLNNQGMIAFLVMDASILIASATLLSFQSIQVKFVFSLIISFDVLEFVDFISNTVALCLEFHLAVVKLLMPASNCLLLSLHIDAH